MNLIAVITIQVLLVSSSVWSAQGQLGPQLTIKKVLNDSILCLNHTIRLSGCERNGRIKINRAGYRQKHKVICTAAGKPTDCSNTKIIIEKVKKTCEKKPYCDDITLNTCFHYFLGGIPPRPFVVYECESASEGDKKVAVTKKTGPDLYSGCKVEDRICPKRNLTHCQYANYRMQCPRKCGLCIEESPVIKESLPVDEARTAIVEVVKDFRQSLISKPGIKKKANINKFNDVMEQVERSMEQSQLSRKKYKLPELKEDIKQAVIRGNMRFARRTLGLALYTANRLSSKSTGRRGKRSLMVNAKSFLEELKRDLGDEKFSKLFALEGEVTLMFAIDITGSMAGMIEQAKKIAIEISNLTRIGSVDYILSTFGDPIDQGSSVHIEEGKQKKFIDEIKNLIANGGGDCPEYAYQGMFDAFNEDPQEDSPLFVFTDAAPKDASAENIEAVTELAENYGVTINFFLPKVAYCSNFKDFEKLASDRGGHVFRMDSSEIHTMAQFTGDSLNSLVTVGSGTVALARKKRSTNTEIAIPVDDTVSLLIVTVTTANSPSGISLVTPLGITWTTGRTTLSNALVYNIDSPAKGIWKLIVPSSVGKYEYSAKVSSPENIGFKHRYTKSVGKKYVEIRNPLAGELANMNLTITGISNIRESSLSVDVILTSGTPFISNKKLTPVGSSGSRFGLSFRPPSGSFKILLKGKTKTGKEFQRISENMGEAKSLVLKEFYNSKRNTIERRGRTLIMLCLFNGSAKTQRFTVSFKDTLGYRVSLLGRKVHLVKKKRKKFLRVLVRYNGGPEGRVGQTENVIVIVKGDDDATAEVVQLMVK